jgi:hypothetical protein
LVAHVAQTGHILRLKNSAQQRARFHTGLVEEVLVSDPTYRIPTTGLYLETDGTLVPKPQAGATVVNATEAVTAKLTAAYVGKGLQIMSNTGGNAPSGGKTKNPLKALGDATEGIVLVGDAVALGLWFAEFMGQMPAKKDPVIAELEQLHAELNAIDDLVLGAWTTSRGDQLAILRAHAATPLQIAQEYVAENSPQTAEWASKIGQADFASRFAVNVFKESGLDEGFWLRPFSLKAMGLSQDAAMGPGSPNPTWAHFHPDRVQIITNPGKPVWDYRFALPATVYAMVSRLAVIKAIAPRSLQRGKAGCREILGYVRFLPAVVKRIQDGMWEITGLPTDEWSRFLFGWRGQAPVAAAQMHSGYGFARVIYAYEWEHLRPSDPALWPPGLVEPFNLEYRTFDEKWQVASENVRKVGAHWWHLIWRDIGMIEMCRIISDLERACTPRVFSHWVSNAQKKLITASTDETSRSAASVASGLAQLTSTGQAADDAVRSRRSYPTDQNLERVGKLLAINLDTIAREIGGRGIVRERVQDLPGGPGGGDVEVDDAAEGLCEPRCWVLAALGWPRSRRRGGPPPPPDPRSIAPPTRRRRPRVFAGSGGRVRGLPASPLRPPDALAGPAGAAPAAAPQGRRGDPGARAGDGGRGNGAEKRA